MHFRKITADKIFDGYHFLNDKVLVIGENGVVEDIIPSKEAGDDVKKYEGILSPGFVNCHCHLELSHMKGKIPEKTGLVDFVFKIVMERSASEDELLAAIADAENEMLQNGIVAVGDICNNTSTLQQKEKSRLRYYNFIEASGWLPSVADIRLDRALSIYDDFKNQNRAGYNSVVPHAPYSVSPQLWEKMKPYFDKKTVTIHNQETKFEDDFFLSGEGDFTRMYDMMKIDNSHHIPTGQSSIQSYFHHLTHAASIILVHNTFTKEEDILWVEKTLAQSNLFHTSANCAEVNFCICLNANLYIEDAVPQVDLLRKHNCNIVLGTDSLASNHSLSIINEMITIKKHFSHVALEEMLLWATSNGANALQMQDKVGSFKKGLTPGVLCITEDLTSCTRII